MEFRTSTKTVSVRFSSTNIFTGFNSQNVEVAVSYLGCLALYKPSHLAKMIAIQRRCARTKEDYWVSPLSAYVYEKNTRQDGGTHPLSDFHPIVFRGLYILFPIISLFYATWV